MACCGSDRNERVIEKWSFWGESQFQHDTVPLVLTSTLPLTFMWRGLGMQAKLLRAVIQRHLACCLCSCEGYTLIRRYTSRGAQLLSFYFLFSKWRRLLIFYFSSWIYRRWRGSGSMRRAAWWWSGRKIVPSPSERRQRNVPAPWKRRQTMRTSSTSSCGWTTELRQVFLPLYAICKWNP